MAPARTESPRPYRLAEVNAGITLTYGRQVDGGEGKGEGVNRARFRPPLPNPLPQTHRVDS